MRCRTQTPAAFLVNADLPPRYRIKITTASSNEQTEQTAKGGTDTLSKTIGVPIAERALPQPVVTNNL